MFAVASGDVKGAVFAASSFSGVLALTALTYAAFAVNKYDALADGPLATFAGLRWLSLLALLAAVGVELFKVLESVSIFESRRKM